MCVVFVLCCSVIRADKDSNNIHIYDGRGSSVVLHTFDKLHNNPVVMMKVIIMFNLEYVTGIFLSSYNKIAYVDFKLEYSILCM